MPYQIKAVPLYPNLKLMDMTDAERFERLLAWSVDGRSLFSKIVRRSAIKARSFPFSMKRRGISPDKDNYLVEMIVNGKDMTKNMASACILRESGCSVNPDLLYPITLDRYDGETFIVTLKGHSLDRYAERCLKKGKDYKMSDDDLVAAWKDMRIYTFNENDVTHEITAPTACGMMLGTIDRSRNEVIVRTFIANSNFYPNQSMEKRNLEKAREIMDDFGIPRSIDIVSKKALTYR